MFKTLVFLVLLGVNCQGQTYDTATGCNWDGGQLGGGPLVYYLDRQRVACGSSEAISKFKLARCNNTQVKYDYTCRTDVNIANSPGVVDKTTDCQEDNGADITVLRHHTISCVNENGAIYEFQLQRCVGNTQLFYKYKCRKFEKPLVDCINLRTNSAWNTDLHFLDRHTIECTNGRVLTEFKYHPCWTGHFDYHFTCCQAAQESCKVVKIEANQPLSPINTGFRVVGIALSASCADGEKELAVETEMAIEETIGFSTGTSKEHSFETTVDIEYEAGFTVKAKLGASASGGESESFSTTRGRETSISRAAGQSWDISYDGRSAAMIWAVADQYKLDAAEVPATFTLRCDNGELKTTIQTISITSQTYGDIFFQDTVKTIENRTACNNNGIPLCVRALRADLFSKGSAELLNDFRACFA